MSKIKGSCMCGNAQYSSDEEPFAHAVCHCLDCQKQTGTAYSVVVGLHEAELVLSGTSHATVITVGDTGNVYCETAQSWVTIDRNMENHDRMMPV